MLRCPRFLAPLSVAGLLVVLVASAAAPAPVLAPVLALPSAATASIAPAPTVFSIDAVHSSVLFRIQHMGVSFFHGRFNSIEGQFTLDAEKPAQSSVEVTIQAESVDTNSGKRDDHVRSPDFLNASEFPEIRFKSQSVKALEGGRFEVAGEFTLHGESKPLTVEVEQTGLAASPRGGGQMAGFETTFSFKRSDFGMDNMLDALGDEVRITVAVEGHAK